MAMHLRRPFTCGWLIFGSALPGLLPSRGQCFSDSAADTVEDGFLSMGPGLAIGIAPAPCAPLEPVHARAAHR